MTHRTAKFRENMLYKHTFKLWFVWLSLFQFIAKSSNCKKSTILLPIGLVFWSCLLISKKIKYKMRTREFCYHNMCLNMCVTMWSNIERYLLKISTMKSINFWRFSLPRFLTNSLTKSIAAVLGLYKSSIISAELQRGMSILNCWTQLSGGTAIYILVNDISEVTITLPHIFMRILLPKLLIIITEAHKREDDLEKNNIKSGLQQAVHVALWDTA